MMQEVISTLQGISPQDFLWSVAVLVYLTCLGIVPNNNDLVLVSATLIAKLKFIPLASILGTMIGTWVLGETTMYLLGLWVGKRLIHMNFIQKRISPETWSKIATLVNEKPLPLFLLLRITPIFRAYLMVGLGSVGLRPRTFFKFHPGILITYIVILGSTFYYLGEVIQAKFGAYQGWIALAMIAAWMISLFIVGRKFTANLMSRT